MTDLLTRTEFKDAVFARAAGRCEVCRARPPVDAHHIVERRLFEDGGYYLDNGAALCAECHLRAETTEVSPGLIRTCAGIGRVVLPPHMYADQAYDKWGNPVLPSGQRMRGELFHDPSVQRVIAAYLHLFTNRVKYPRTYHLPTSPGLGDDDRVMESMAEFADGDPRVIVTRKMDGECTTLYSDGLHARSLEYHTDPRRDWVRRFHAGIAHEIPADWRVCGENLFAVHSIEYRSLPSYFLLFSVWNDMNWCLSWDDTVEWAALLGARTVPILYDGSFRGYLERVARGGLTSEPGQEHEGYVLRLASAFHYREFRRCVGKYVRENHVQTSEHWMRKPLVKNGLGGAA